LPLLIVWFLYPILGLRPDENTKALRKRLQTVEDGHRNRLQKIEGLEKDKFDLKKKNTTLERENIQLGLENLRLIKENLALKKEM
jgi:hypothetical protein